MPSVNCQGRTDKAQLLIVIEFKGPGPVEFCPRSKGNGGRGFTNLIKYYRTGQEK